ncbi:MAG: TolC family protein [Verrucomicrobia bacterium]|nr:TolC family protein [Verrucomicrobiota bacterium]
MKQHTGYQDLPHRTVGAGFLRLLTAGAVVAAALQVSAQDDTTTPAPVDAGGADAEQVRPPTEVIPSVDVPLDELTSEITEVGNPPVAEEPKTSGEIGKLASRLFGGTTSRGTGRPVKEGKLVIPYEPDPRVLDSRKDSILATLGNESISLMDAVRKTLEHAPEIQIAREEVIASEGAVQNEAGQFDVQVVAGASYVRGQEEMDIRRVAGEQGAFDRDKGFVSASNDAIEAITNEIQVIRDGGSPTSRFVRNPDGSVTVDGSFGADLSSGDVSSTVVTGEQDLETQLDDALIDAAKDLATPMEAMNIAEIEKQFIEDNIASRKFVRKILRKNVSNALKRIERFPPNQILREDVTTYDLALVKQFRNGTVLRPFAEYTGEQDHLSRRKGQGRINRTEFGLRLTLPLGKGRGYIATAGSEIASGFELDASRYELEHTVSQRVLTTTLAYWDVVAAQERLRLLLESEMIADSILKMADAMIKADLIPGVTRGQAIGRQTTVQASRIRSEFDLLRAQQALAIAMGSEGEALIDAPLAADPFPMLVQAAAVEAQDLEGLVRQARFKRGDHKAAIQQKIAIAVIIDQAEANLKPACDLQLGISYTGLDEGGQWETLFNPYEKNHAGPSGFVSLQADWPFGNRIPRSELQLFEAQSRKVQQQIEIIERSIDSGIVTAKQQVRNAAVFHAFNVASMEQTRLALIAENEKLRMGSSTIIDSILAEERLTNSRTGLIDARLQQAKGLAQLRFQSGTLLKAVSENPEISSDDLVTLPPIEISAPAATPVEQVEEASKSWRNVSPWRMNGPRKAR